MLIKDNNVLQLALDVISHEPISLEFRYFNTVWRIGNNRRINHIHNKVYEYKVSIDSPNFYSINSDNHPYTIGAPLLPMHKYDHVTINLSSFIYALKY